MKTKITLLCLIVMLFISIKKSQAQIDLVPGINYSYNPPGSNGIITNITVDACNNDVGNAGSFDVAMYLYDQSTTNYWIIGTTNIPSLSGNACITISNWNININNTSGIPSGTYRLGIWVDSNNDIAETDENNNAGLLSGNINYTPSSSGIVDFSALAKNVSLQAPSPNPTNGITKFNFSLATEGQVSLNVFDVTGKLVFTLVNDKLQAGTYTYEMDASVLETGIYFCTLHTDGISVSQKLSVTK